MTPESPQLATNHFERLGLPVAFELDPAALQSHYIAAARLTHPDLADADEESQVEAMDQSAAVNEAYRILSDPRQRGEYLLQLRGGPSPEEDRSLPHGFLDHVLTIREQLTEAAGDANEVTALLARVRDEESQRLVALSDDFRESSSLHRIRIHLNALRYLQRITEQR